MNGLRSHIKNSKECFIRYPNTSKSVKKTLNCASFIQPTSRYLDILMKHSFSCLIYFIQTFNRLYTFFPKINKFSKSEVDGQKDVENCQVAFVPGGTFCLIGCC